MTIFHFKVKHSQVTICTLNMIICKEAHVSMSVQYKYLFCRLSSVKVKISPQLCTLSLQSFRHQFSTDTYLLLRDHTPPPSLDRLFYTMRTKLSIISISAGESQMGCPTGKVLENIHIFSNVGGVQIVYGGYNLNPNF